MNNDDYIDRIGAGDKSEDFVFGLKYTSNYLEKCGLDRETTLEDAKDKLLWGTYGKKGELLVAKWIRLVKADSEHLLNILKTQYPMEETRKVIVSILGDRGMAVEDMSDVAFHLHERFGVPY